MFVWLAAWRKKNWARWAILIFYLISLPWTFEGVAGPAFWLNFLIVVIDAVALYFIFTGDARRWFQNEPDTIGEASD